MRLSLSVSEELEVLLATCHTSVARWIALHPTAIDIRREPADALRKYGWPNRVIATWIEHRSSFSIDRLLAQCEDKSIRPLLPSHADWPKRFNHLDKHAPRLLFLRGILSDRPHIALIGTRTPTAYGLRALDQFIANLRDASLAIVSGLALGTDGRAHAQALHHRLPTTAILGSSVAREELYPRANERLAEEILESGGGIVSEIAPGKTIHKGSFPERNRLIAALCHALIVTEAKERSGTLITARIAMELGREVLAIPGSIFSPFSVGTNRLLAAGARVCGGVHDLWSALAVDPPADMERERTHLHTNAEDHPILEALLAQNDGMNVDQLSALLKRSSEILTARLGLLELQGLVREIGPGRWVRAGLV